MVGGWQTQVYVQPAAAIAGDRASQNPIFSAPAGPGGLVSGALGLTVGVFAWIVAPMDPNGGPQVANSFGVGNVSGFVMREQQALNTTYLSDAGMVVQPGYSVSVQVAGDFWVKNDGTTNAVRGQKAYAFLNSGKASFAATASPITGATSTGSTITAQTFSVTGQIIGDIMTVSVVGSGTVYPGATVSGTGISTGNQVVSQLNGTPGGVGQYAMSIGEQNTASETISGTYGLLTIGALTSSGPFTVGDQLAATGSVVAGTQITASVTGAGGTGATMVVNNNTAVGSQAINAVSNVETPWYAVSEGLPGELVKISTNFNAQLS